MDKFWNSFVIEQGNWTEDQYAKINCISRYLQQIIWNTNRKQSYF